MVNKKSEMDWDAISHVISSELRLKVLIHLTKKASTPTKISEKLGEPISRVSTALRELSEIKAIKCLTPDRRKGKIYYTTEKGKKIIEMLHEMTDIR